MAGSLQDQLLKAGVANKKQAKKAQQEKRAAQGKKGAQKGQPAAESNEAALAAQRAQAEKAERDRQLNLERKAEAERKAIAAQIRQLIDQNRVAREDAEEPYHFTDAGKLRSLRVTSVQRDQLARGRLEIVRDGDRYELVPAEVADKIRARDASCVIARNRDESKPDQDDPYAAYQVPDDLMW